MLQEHMSRTVELYTDQFALRTIVCYNRHFNYKNNCRTKCSSTDYLPEVQLVLGNTHQVSNKKFLARLPGLEGGNIQYMQF